MSPGREPNPPSLNTLDRGPMTCHQLPLPTIPTPMTRATTRTERSRLARSGSSLWPSPRRECCGATSKSPGPGNESWPSEESVTSSLRSDLCGGRPRCRWHLGKGSRRPSSTDMSALSTCTTSQTSGSVRYRILYSWFRTRSYTKCHPNKHLLSFIQSAPDLDW